MIGSSRGNGYGSVMPAYDFSQLSPHDFELLCRDLLQEEWGIVLETFKSGKDGGVDFRHARAGADTIVQCKRFVETGLTGLMRELRREADSVRVLRPGRYVLLTSVPLSPLNKDGIVEVVGAGHLAPYDVLGRGDLNNLLGRHPRVEQSHYKLWLASTDVLGSVLHNDVVFQSGFQVDRIHGEIRRYVQGRSYAAAAAALRTDRVVILSGQPGVGKTTLANLLLYEHLAHGFEPVVIRQDFTEGKRLFRPGVRQVFYFDDFMGVTFLGDRGSDAHRRDYRAVAEFIDMVIASKDKLLILTTREHLFHQALGMSEHLRHAGLGDRKLVVGMGDYGRRQRAEILYNHLFFSDLPTTYRDELLRGEFYLKIVDHKRFNPRLIEWLSTFRRVRSVKPAEFQGFVSRLLDDPSIVWRHAYEQQISDAGRSLLLVLFTLGGKAGGEQLRQAFSALHDRRAGRYGFVRRPEDFGSACAELQGAFLRPTGMDAVEFIDPSVADWLNSVVGEVPDNVLDLVVGSIHFSQIEQIWRFASSGLGEPVKAALRRDGPEIAARMTVLAEPERGHSQPEPRSGCERHLVTLMRIAEALHAVPFAETVDIQVGRVRAAWAISYCDPGATVALVRTIDAVTWTGLGPLAAFRRECMTELVGTASQGCASDDLREVLELLDRNGGEDSSDLRAKLSPAAVAYARDHFTDELDGCQSEQDYQNLLDSLTYFSERLDADLRYELAKVEEGRAAYIESQLEREDEEYDGYRDARYERRESDEQIRSMFGSLQSEG